MMVGGKGALPEAKWSLGRALRIVHTNPDLVHDHPLSGMLEVIAAIAIPSRASRVATALDRARRHPDPWTRAAALMAYGHWAENQGRATDAERDFRAALEEFRLIGDRWGLASTMESIAQIGELRGDLRAVIEIEEEALQLLQELEAFEDLAQALCILARQQARVGDLDAAAANIERAGELAHRYADVETRLWVEATTGEIDRRRGNIAAARRRADEVLAGTQGTTFFPAQLRAVFLVAVAFLDLVEGRLADARSHGVDAIAIAVEHHDQAAVASAVDVLACTELAERDGERAAILFGIAAGTRGLPDFGDPDVVMAREKCRTELGSVKYQNAYDRGVVMSYDAAIEFLDQARRR
jgi:tetratricopeptide (TPR) repeat protein